MDPPFTLYVGLDTLSAVLTLAVVAFFLKIWRRTENTLHLLFAVGFLFVSGSYLTVSTSQFDLAGRPSVVDALRLAGQTGGALVLASAYLSRHHHGAVRPWIAFAWAAAAGAVLVGGLYLFAPPVASIPPSATTFAWGHAAQFLAYILCVGFSSAAFRREPRPDNLLVPLAFLAFALSKYTWVLIDLSNADLLVPFVYFWRLSALALLLLALLLPPRAPVPEALQHAAP